MEELDATIQRYRSKGIPASLLAFTAVTIADAMTDAREATGQLLRDHGFTRPMAAAGDEVYVWGDPVPSGFDRTVFYPLSIRFPKYRFPRNRGGETEKPTWVVFVYGAVIELDACPTMGKVRCLMQGLVK